MAAFREKIRQYDELLSNDIIDENALRRLLFRGALSERSIRAKCWKLVLNYLPLKRISWEEKYADQRATYKQFIDEMIVQPGLQHAGENRVEITQEDHPLSLNTDSQWGQYFKDNEMLLQIDKDCRRLCPDLSFFQSATNYPNKMLADLSTQSLRHRVEQSVLKAENVSKTKSGMTHINATRSRRRTDSMVVLAKGQEAHWEVAERILFIYVKLNPGQGYVQGMNEIIGPIYYTMASDPDTTMQEHAEADAFWCFTNLMAEIRDTFIKQLDDSDSGIGNQMNRLLDMLKAKDIQLWIRLDQQELKPQFFAFRWLTLLLSQEFSLPDVLRLWDSLLADEHRFDFLLSICCAMLILVRNDILKGDFTANMKLLQNYPETDVNDIIAKAAELRDR